MKKLMLLTAMLAASLVAAAPALAQVTQGVGNDEASSGDVTTPFSVTNSANNSSSCAGGGLQFGQTGNNQNAQGSAQTFDSKSGDVGFGGGSFGATPSSSQTCEQTIQQSAAASAAPKAEQQAPPPPAPKVVPAPAPPPPAPKAVPAPVPPPPAPKAEVQAVPPKAEVVPAPAPPPPPPPPAPKAEEKKLPETGGTGSASLLALGVGALLVGGGLLARRIF